MKRSTAVPAAALAVCLVWAGIAIGPAADARGRADQTSAEAEQANAEQAAAEAERDDLAHQIEALEQRVARQTAVLAAIRSGSERVAGQRSIADEELGTAQAEEAKLAGDLAHTQGVADHRRKASENLEACTSGTAQAIALLSGGDRPGGLRRLQSITDACRAAEAYLAEGKGDVVFPWDFPDPFVLNAGDRYYAYATNSVGGHVQVITSGDLRSWNWVGEALPVLPSWADPYATWAPSVMWVGGRYALFFTARLGNGSQTQCIGVAFSNGPTGPFGGSPSEPLVCQAEESGSIDPSPFLGADGTPHLTWKSEGEAGGGVAKIWSAPLTGDATSFASPPTELLAADRGSEGGTIEGPSMVRMGGQWFLLYSSNRWNTADYHLDVARCDSPSGPCNKPADNTILASHDSVKGPGGGEVFVARDGSVRLAYHAWRAPDIGFPNSRFLHVDQLRLGGSGWPVVQR